VLFTLRVRFLPSFSRRHGPSLTRHFISVHALRPSRTRRVVIRSLPWNESQTNEYPPPFWSREEKRRGKTREIKRANENVRENAHQIRCCFKNDDIIITVCTYVISYLDLFNIIAFLFLFLVVGGGKETKRDDGWMGRFFFLRVPPSRWRSHEPSVCLSSIREKRFKRFNTRSFANEPRVRFLKQNRTFVPISTMSRIEALVGIFTKHGGWIYPSSIWNGCFVVEFFIFFHFSPFPGGRDKENGMDRVPLNPTGPEPPESKRETNF